MNVATEQNLLTRILRKKGGGAISVISELPTWQETGLEKNLLAISEEFMKQSKRMGSFCNCCSCQF